MEYTTLHQPPFGGACGSNLSLPRQTFDAVRAEVGAAEEEEGGEAREEGFEEEADDEDDGPRARLALPEGK